MAKTSRSFVPVRFVIVVAALATFAVVGCSDAPTSPPAVVPRQDPLGGKRAQSSGGPLAFLYDDFLGTMASSDLWHIPTFVSSTDGTYVGRTQMRVSQNSALPAAAASNVIIKLETYNPTGFSFYGTDLLSNQTFSVGNGLDIKIRARIDSPVTGGTVGGLFLYDLEAGSTTIHDEIDFELLGNLPTQVQTNVYAAEPLGAGHPVFTTLAGSSTIGDYHIYEIKWLSTSVSWYIDGVLIRTETVHVPSQPMHLHLNNWAPDASWAEAYSSAIQPTGTAGANQVFSMSVDYVDVEPIAPTVVLQLSQPTLAVGQSGTLTWSSTNATSCDNDGIENWSPSGTTSGSTSFTVLDNSWLGTYTYHFHCVNGVGGPSTTATATLTIVPAAQTLTVTSSGTGSGTVSSTPSNVNCTVTAGSVTGVCSPIFPFNTAVTLTATPASGSTFVGWSGGCTGVGSCTLTMDQARSVVAMFSPVGTVPGVSLHLSQPTLAVGQTGTLTWSSTNATSCDNDGIQNWSPSGTTSGSTSFTVLDNSWLGTYTYHFHCVNGVGGASATATATLTIVPAAQALTVTSSGTGSGTVSSTPSNVNCTVTLGSATGGCSASFAFSTAVTLTATPASGSTFAGWTGGCAGVGSCTVTMDQVRSVVAIFSPVGTAPTVSLQLSQPTLVVGQSGTLTWSSTNATSCDNDGIENWSPSGTTAGSTSFTVRDNTWVGTYTYHFHCVGAGGQSATTTTTLTIVPNF
jgi:beta-glucanase (GH16 family)